MKSKTVADAITRDLIASGTTIRGEIESNGDIRIDGQLIGTIRSKGKVVVGQSGVVEGEMICAQADISGELNTGRLTIEVGAVFSGKCEMLLPENANHEQKK